MTEHVRKNQKPSLRCRHAFRAICAALLLLPACSAFAGEQHGQVMFNGLPVPGATVTAIQGSKKLTAVSDQTGRYSFPDIADGAWKLHIEMFLFAPLDQDITVAPGGPGITFDLKMLPLDEIIAQTKVVKIEPKPVAAEAPPSAKPGAAKPAENAEIPKPSDDSDKANDGFLVNGSVNNAASSQFSLAQAFGNQRKGSKGLYTGGIGLILDNSALDARSYSLSGQQAPKPAYNRVTAVASISGPIRIPHLMPRGPNFFAVYEWTRNQLATTETGLVPTAAQRTAAIDPVAQALLAYYPLPNVVGNNSYNYQVPVLNGTHQDSVQLRLDKSINQKNQLYGSFGLQSTRADNTNLFRFRDATATLGINATANWQHRLGHGLYSNLGYRFSRLRLQVLPFFANRTNVSGNAGITASNGSPTSPGTNQDPTNWGPPTLIFSSGIASLGDAQSSFNRFRTEAVSETVQWYRGRHNITVGGDFRRQEYNYLQQQDPRGTFTFTGAAFGSDLAGFQRGVPDTASITTGNADKYLRQNAYDAHGTDDWRLRPDLTLNIGVRWEYGSPITEIKNRLVNLDIASGFTNAATVLASSPTGPFTGQRYPTSLLRPVRNRVEPRLGVAWRPIAGSSLVVRAGYGVYADTSVYQQTALRMAQQAPLSRSVTANNADCAQSLKTGPNACSTITPFTFGIDPGFRVGYAQTWQLAVQRDLPAALQMTATYLGIKGTRGVQEFLPNTYPLGATDPCPQCPSGFVYRTSNGNSTRQSGSLQLRRRLRSGFTASLQYTYSKSIDNDSVLGGQGPLSAGSTTQNTTASHIAQNWLDLRAERGLSTFDQRHLLTTSFQYTTGMGLGGGTLMKGWRGRVYKEWTVVAQINAGSGLPETPVYLAALNGTGYTGTIRPDRTAANLYAPPAGRFLNLKAYAAPQAGRWGTAGRNSITGPGQFSFNASLSRTFRLDKRFNLDVRLDSNNVLNHPVYTSYNTTISPCNVATNPSCSAANSLALVNPLFGVPTGVNGMRTSQITARLRF